VHCLNVYRFSAFKRFLFRPNSRFYFYNFLIQVIYVCFLSFSEILLTDPTNEEESLSSGVMTIVVQGDKLCSVHKPGGSALTESQLQECISGAVKRAEHVNELINTALKSLDT
jgi:exosome complex RNA-binding protein Rrp42 (RNase PH superfamily)